MGVFRLIAAIFLIVWIVNIATDQGEAKGLPFDWPVALAILCVLLVADLWWIVAKWRAGAKEINEMRAKREQRKVRIEQHGVTAEATIENIDMGGMTITSGVKRELEVVLTLNVIPKTDSPFTVKTETMISELHVPQYQPGKKVQIKYDPVDRNNTKIIKTIVD